MSILQIIDLGPDSPRDPHITQPVVPTIEGKAVGVSARVTAIATEVLLRATDGGIAREGARCGIPISEATASTGTRVGVGRILHGPGSVVSDAPGGDWLADQSKE
jgi:hypothetical protein